MLQVVSGVPLSSQSWLHSESILVLSISIQPISGTQQKVGIGADGVARPRGGSASGEADDLESPLSAPFLPKDLVMESSASKYS